MENIDKNKNHQAAETDAAREIDRAIDDLMGGLDDDIIELSDKAEASQAPDDDEEVIDLFERTTPDPPANDGIEGDDDILELSDMVEAPQAPDDDEEVIDLFERTTPDTPDSDDILELSDMIEDPQGSDEDDDVIDLLEPAIPDTPDSEGFAEDDDLIELTDMAEAPAADLSDDTEGLIELVDRAAPDEPGGDLLEEDDFLELTAVAEPPVSGISDDTEDIIELVETAVPDGPEGDLLEDDDLLELTDVVEPTASDDSEDIIELVENVIPEAPDNGDLEEDDGLIELADRVAAPKAGIPDPSDDIIELLDTATLVNPAVEELSAAEVEDMEDILELTESVDAAPIDDQPIAEEDASSAFLTVDAREDQDDEVLALSDTVAPAADDPKAFAPLFASPAADQDGTPDVFIPDDTASIDADQLDLDLDEDKEEISLSELLAETSDQESAADTEGKTATEPPLAQPSDDGPAEIIPPEEEPQQIIQLSNVLNHPLPQDEDISEEFRLDVDEVLASEDMENDLDDTAGALGIDLEEMEAEGLDVSETEIERALERIIQRKFGTTIEELIAKTVERKVSIEIENLRRSMMDDDQ